LSLRRAGRTAEQGAQQIERRGADMLRWLTNPVRLFGWPSTAGEVKEALQAPDEEKKAALADGANPASQRAQRISKWGEKLSTMPRSGRVSGGSIAWAGSPSVSDCAPILSVVIEGG